MNAIRLPSYAKINLGLLIKGKRSDGYHEIESLLLQIDLLDEIELKSQANPEIVVRCNNPVVPTDENNLCVRAANLIKKTSGISKGLEINLTKNIPMGAGLGGGSSNAATTLMGLNKLWNLDFTPEFLQKLAAQLGADVPFFIHGGAAVARGRGELLSTINFNLEWPILIIFPEIHVSTQQAYAGLNLSLTMKKKNIKLPHFKDSKFNNVDFYKVFINEFERAVFKNYPILAEIKRSIYRKNPVFTSMSGSGSSIFGIFHNLEDAFEAKAEFDRKFPTFITHSILWGYNQIV
ncbi:MAG: 4-(cytidine 5'-diphospho)-2-C-methyl-D-erythritol kinase [bacterium]